jgi:transposase
MALFVGLDVSLKRVSICIVKADGTVVWEGKALSEPASLIKALARRRKNNCTFAAKVQVLLENKPELWVAIEPLLEARNVMRRQHVVLDRHLSQIARKDEVCRRLMTISGVGPIVSLAFKATVDDPSRFKNSKAVAAHLGLTPRVYQSGELDISGHISKCGDRFMRHALYEAANSHLRISKKWSSLRAWGLKLGKRVGMKKACVAVARKLAIIMHRMWLDERDFQYGRQPTNAAAR